MYQGITPLCTDVPLARSRCRESKAFVQSRKEALQQMSYRQSSDRVERQTGGINEDWLLSMRAWEVCAWRQSGRTSNSMQWKDFFAKRAKLPLTQCAIISHTESGYNVLCKAWTQVNLPVTHGNFGQGENPSRFNRSQGNFVQSGNSSRFNRSQGNFVQSENPSQFTRCTRKFHAKREPNQI